MIYSIVFADDIKYVNTQANEKQLRNLLEDYYKLTDKKGFLNFAKSKGMDVQLVELSSDIKNIFLTDIHNIVD
jgi:hypothetical protein